MANPGQSGGGKEQQAYENLSVTGQSAFQISREMLSLTNLIPNYEHLKILIVSSEIASEPEYFSSVLDSFIRDHEIRKGIRVMVADGDAKDLFDIQTNTEDLPAFFIDTILENNIKSLELIDPVTIGTVHRYLLNDNSYLMPLLTLNEGNLAYRDVAVFDGKSDQQVGTMKTDAIQGYKLIKGNMTNGAITFYIDNKLMIYELKNAKSTIKINTTNPQQIEISIAIDTEGSIGEMYGSKSLLDQSYISEIENSINKKIEQLVNNTLEIAQNELQVDFLGFRSIMKQRHYDDWKKIDKNWEKGELLFSKSKVDVTAHTMVRNIGSSDKAKDERKE